MPFARKVCSGIFGALADLRLPCLPDFAARVQPEQVPQKPEEEEYEIGDEVRARYSANGAWYTARIISRVMGRPGTYEVAWSDGDPHDTIKHKSNIRKQEEEPQLAPAEAAVNERVQAWVNKCSGGLLRVEVSGSAGRYIVASRRVEAGAILTQDVPYAMFPIQADACTWCMRPAASESCCDRCKACGTLFCGPACLEAASSLHACECPAFCALESVLDRLSRVNSPQQARRALRILALRVVEGTPADDKLHWSDMETCVAHAEKVSVLSASLEESMKSDSVLLFNLLPGNMATGITASVVMQLLLRLKYNVASLVETDSFQPVGGLFGIPVALINHSCQPNIFFNFEPGDCTRKVVGRAIQDIEEGGEICMPYVDVIEPRVVRRQKLFFHYLFDCACAECALSGADDACQVLTSDSLKCAMVCTSCSAMLVLPAPSVQGGKVAPTNKMSKVLCSSCGGEHFVHELEESAESARKLLHEAVVGASGESDTRARVLSFLQKRETMRLHALHHLVYRANSILAGGAPPGSSVAPARELADHPRAMLHILLSWALGSCSLPLDTDSLLEAAQEHMTPHVGRHLLTLGMLLVFACEEGKAGVPHSQVENAGDKLQESEKVLRCAVRVLAVCHGKEVSSFIFEAASQLSLCE